MSHECRSILYLMDEQPPGWLDSSLSSFCEYSQSRDSSIGLESESFEARIKYLQELQKQRWVESVGRSLNDIHVTVVIPIHNEAKCLPSMLGSLMMSDVPTNAHIHFKFMVNSSTDKSAEIVTQFLNAIGHVQYSEINFQNVDEGLEKTQSSVRKDNTTFSLIQSSTASKTRMLNIGNELALHHGDDVVISIDANNWLEPGTLRSLIATAYDKFSQQEAYVIGGQSHSAYRPSVYAKLSKQTKMSPRNQEKSSRDLHGWLMGWDPHWLATQGGLPELACDDYTLSVMSRLSGREVFFDNEGSIWGYFPNNIQDRLKAQSRSVRDRLQVLAVLGHDERVREIVESDEELLRPLNKRIAQLFSSVVSHPIKGPLFILRFLMWEYARNKGFEEYRNNPKSQTWQEIASTK